MARWKITRRSKATKETDTDINIAPGKPSPSAQNQTIAQQKHSEPKETPVMEYNEELYTRGTPVKKPRPEYRQEPIPRTSWEDPCTIERNVDKIGTTKAGDITTNPQVSDQIEKKVDRLIAKKKLER